MKRKKVIERLIVRCARKFGVKRKQRLDLRAEHKAALGFGVDKRLHAESIARQGQRFFMPIPDGKGKHAAQFGEAFFQAFAREQAQQNFGIRMATEGFTGTLKILAQLAEIVDFTVKDNDVTAIGAVHRLVSQFGQVEN